LSLRASTSHIGDPDEAWRIQFATIGDIQSGSEFWVELPAVWFTQAEAQITLAGISSEIKVCHVISQVEHRHDTEVKDIITFQLDKYPYTTLRTDLVRRLSPSREQRIRQLLTLEEMGKRKPFQFLRHLRSLARDVPHDFFRSIWSSRLPPT
jgi:hypothetical protein